MINLNQIFERGTRWHAVGKDMKDIMFCSYNGEYAPHMNSLSLPRQHWEVMGFKFIGELPYGINWDEYLENYHNEELASFKLLCLDGMCEQLRKIYVNCEQNVNGFNSDRRYSKFREILNNAIGIRHGKGNRVATKKDCVEAFKEHQEFINE